MAWQLSEPSGMTKQQASRCAPQRSSARVFQAGVHPILQLQRTLGNHRVAQLIKSKRLTPDGKIIGLQPKLTVGAADDQYEQEADHVARQVVSMPDSVAMATLQQKTPIGDDTSKVAPSTLQTKPLPLAASITSLVQRQPQTAEIEENKDKEDGSELLQARLFNKSFEPPLQRLSSTDEEETEPLQAKPAESLHGSFEVGDEVESRLSQSKGGGSPLPDPVRTYMEPRFGVDFNHVRVHTGIDAMQMNWDVGAQAFTHGSDIYFGEGRSPSNLELTAHELTHVVQQTGAIPLQAKRQEENIAGRRPLAHELAHVQLSASVVSADKGTENLGLSVQKGITGSDPVLSTESGVRCHEAEQLILARVAVGREVEAHLTSPRFKGDERLEACFDDRSRLRVGDSGASVEKVQGALIDLGFDVGPLGADGQYGAQTAEAVKAFKRQERLGFEQFGDVGPGTMRRLDQIFPEESSGESRGNVVAKPLALTGEGDSGPGEQFIEAPLAPPEALTVPPEEGDCDPPVAASAFAGGDLVAGGGSATVGSGVPCDFDPAPPGALSDFERDLRSNPSRISAVVIDPDSQEIIGYRVRTDSTILQLVDREGNFVAGNEKSLDQPLIDPIDFIPTPAAVAKGAVVVGKIGLKVLGKLVVKGGGKKGFTVAAAALPRMRAISQAMLGRVGRAASKNLPTIARNITLEGLNHSFDKHAAQFFGRSVSRGTHFELWRGIIERATQSSRVFPWSLRESKTIAHLATIEGKQLVVQFFEESGNLATAFVPTSKELRAMLKVIALSK